MQARAVMKRRVLILKGSWGTQAIQALWAFPSFPKYRFYHFLCRTFVFQAIILGTTFLKLPESTSAYYSRGGILFLYALICSLTTSNIDCPCFVAPYSCVSKCWNFFWLRSPYWSVSPSCPVCLPLRIFALHVADIQRLKFRDVRDPCAVFTTTYCRTPQESRDVPPIRRRLGDDFSRCSRYVCDHGFVHHYFVFPGQITTDSWPVLVEFSGYFFRLLSDYFALVASFS